MFFWLKKPVNSVLMILAVLTMFYHSALGVQVVIEDYISIKGGRHVVLGIVRVAMGMVGVASLWAIAWVAL